MPRAMGEPCSIDADCDTRNCSTDGNETAVGVCHQPLGTVCEWDSDTCSNCLGDSLNTSGICSRDTCDPLDAPNCPTYRDHGFECVMSTDGLYRCYERCLPDDEGDTRFHSCFQGFGGCSSGRDYCN
ncbi:MAG: hypothetical protein M3Y87_15145 [Myxococcota bacterium]|nr:hypothetical protein [Myxococcota bacterium]